jgi:hypothetical protein
MKDAKREVHRVKSIVEHGDQLEAKYSLDPWQHHARLVKRVACLILQGNALGVGGCRYGTTNF